MTDRSSSSASGDSASGDERPFEIEIDTATARPARVYNYLTGGSSNFAVDRDAIDYVAGALPDGIDVISATVQALGAFLERSVRYLIHEAGVRQFLYVGTPVPTGAEIHHVAQQAAPETRFVYVGSDPVVLAHAHALRSSSPEGVTAYVHGSLRRPQEIMRQAAATLDLARPVAVLLPVTLPFVPDENDPDGIVAELLAAVPAGSYLVVAHTTDEIRTEGMADGAKRLSTAVGEPYVTRSDAEVARFFDGLDLVEPGVVQIDQWHPGEVPTPEERGFVAPLYGAVGRKR